MAAHLSFQGFQTMVLFIPEPATLILRPAAGSTMSTGPRCAYILFTSPAKRWEPCWTFADPEAAGSRQSWYSLPARTGSSTLPMFDIAK